MAGDAVSHFFSFMAGVSAYMMICGLSFGRGVDVTVPAFIAALSAIMTLVVARADRSQSRQHDAETRRRALAALRIRDEAPEL